MKLTDLGFDEWFEERAAECGQAGACVARVSAVDRGSYLVRDETAEIPAELSGRLSYRIESPADLPCVGDWVTVQYHNEETAAIVRRVLPRKTFLRRKNAGETIEFQMIAANVDTAFIVQSCHFDFNPHRLDRYLVMAADGQVEQVVILTKTDLIGHDQLDQQLAAISSIAKTRVLALSNVTGVGFDAFRQTLAPGRTYCLLGSSGVGKTTLINRLIGQDAYDTNAVSDTGEGTHTTSRRQLVVLDHGAMLIDTPGMRELGLVGVDAGVETDFDEFVRLAAHCRFSNCSHEHEPGCAIRAAVESGQLSEDRYQSYLKLKKESEFHEMSYRDKRKKDKAFGRFIKSVKKRMKD